MDGAEKDQDRRGLSSQDDPFTLLERFVRGSRQTSRRRCCPAASHHRGYKAFGPQLSSAAIFSVISPRSDDQVSPQRQNRRADRVAVTDDDPQPHQAPPPPPRSDRGLNRPSRPEATRPAARSHNSIAHRVERAHATFPTSSRVGVCFRPGPARTPGPLPAAVEATTRTCEKPL